MERLIDRFAEKVLSTTESFMLESEKNGHNSCYHFYMQCNVGSAKYIYGEYSYNSTFSSGLDLKPKLVAIVSAGKVYIIDLYDLEVLYGNVELPENTYKLTDIVLKENEYVKSVVFPRFFESLKEEPISGGTLDKCKKMARAMILSKSGIIDNVYTETMFNAQDIANSLCGIIDIKDESMKRLTKDRDEWIYKKSFRKKVKELLSDGSVVEDYELRIIDGIKSVNAKTVNVEFELNGKRDIGKINVGTIVIKLRDKDYFSEYSFLTSKFGKEFLNNIGASSYLYDGKELLTCKHITRITYGKKELYVR